MIFDTRFQKSSYVTVGMTPNWGGKGSVPSKLHLMTNKNNITVGMAQNWGEGIVPSKLHLLTNKNNIIVGMTPNWGGKGIVPPSKLKMLTNKNNRQVWYKEVGCTDCTFLGFKASFFFAIG